MNKTTLNSIVKKYPRLSDEETKNLCEKIKNGDKNARDILALSNIGLIFEVCSQLHINEQDREDMFDECFEEYLEKIGRFNPEKGKFSTFIFSWLKDRINKSNFRGIPVRMKQNFGKAKRIEEYFLQEKGRMPDENEMLSYSGFSKKMYKKIKDEKNFFFADSLYRPFYSEDGNSAVLADIIEDKSSFSAPENFAIEMDFLNKLEDYIYRLSKREYQVLDCLYNLSNQYDHPLSLRETQSVTGIGRMTVSSLRDSALEKLRGFFENGSSSIAA